MGDPDFACLGPPSDGPDRVWECEVEERPKGALQKQVYCKKKQFSSSMTLQSILQPGRRMQLFVSDRSDERTQRAEELPAVE